MRMFHFHSGTPTERVIRMLGHFALALTLAVTGSALTVIRAAEDAGSALHLVGGCPAVLPNPDDGTVTFTWETTTPATAHTVEVMSADTEPIRVSMVNDARSHTATVPGLVPGATYAVTITSGNGETTVRSGTCSFRVPGDDRTMPTISTLRVLHVTADTATVAFTTNEPATAWVVATPTAASLRIPATASERANAGPTTTHRYTLAPLAPGTTYAVRAFARDPSGNEAARDLELPLTTYRVAMDDRGAPEIRDVTCAAGDRELTVSFTILTSAASGRIEVRDGDTETTVEAATTANTDGTTTARRTLAGLRPGTPYLIRAIGIDRAGNAGTSSTRSCATR